MIPEFIAEFFANHQNLLWFAIVVLDLGMTLVMFRLFGRIGLVSVVVLNIMLCNLVGPVVTRVLWMNTSAGAIIYSGIYFATDLLGERYGRREANRAVMIGFATSVLVIVTASMALLFRPVPEGYDEHEFAVNAHDSLSFLFTFTPHFVFGSLFAYLVSQTHDVWMFHYLKRLTHGRHLWLRNNVSTILSQAIDTLVFAFVVWTPVFGLKIALQLAGAKYVFKVLIALIDTPFIYWARNWNVSERDWVDQQDPDPKARVAGKA